MSPEEIEDLLADYLGGELDPERKRLFEQYLRTTSDFASEVDSLRRTLSAMRSLEVPGEPPLPRASTRRAGSSRALAVLRYAAVIVLAFVGGYFSRDSVGSNGGGTAAPVVRPGGPEHKRDWELRLASAYTKNAGKSSLARSLTALAQATR